MYLTNAFSLNMLNPEVLHAIEFEVISEEKVKSYAGELWSAIGHPALAVVLSARLGFDVPVNRISVEFNRSSAMIVAQATMPRLAEGQVLSEDDMASIPITYWYLSSESEPERNR